MLGRGKDPLSIKSGPELGVERTAHSLSAGAREIKADRAGVGSLDAWLSWPFC